MTADRVFTDQSAAQERAALYTLLGPLCMFVQGVLGMYVSLVLLLRFFFF